MIHQYLINDFDRSINSDQLQAVIGRALIVATKFDFECKRAAEFYKIKQEPRPAPAPEMILILGDKIKNLFPRVTVLGNATQILGKQDDVKTVLKNAIDARNYIAHELCINRTGCLDSLEESDFIKDLSERVSSIALADYLVSAVLCILNQEAFSYGVGADAYVNKVVSWVVEK